MATSGNVSHFSGGLKLDGSKLFFAFNFLLKFDSFFHVIAG